MLFERTEIENAFLIKPERMEDDRGFFARTYCQHEFTDHGLNPLVAQCNLSFNEQKGTLRGLHSQRPPHEEAKLVRCTQGAIYDVILDLRPDSPSYLKHVGIELSAENRMAIYVPEGVYHGFLTLEDRTEVFYQMSQFYVPDQLLGVRWNDPAFSISWPGTVTNISDRDNSYADFKRP